MMVKTFRGGNTKSVLEQVKAELGPEAVILSTRSLEEAGKPCCEMTAAREPSGTVDHGAWAYGDRPGWGEWHEEWNQIKTHLMALLKPRLNLDALSPRQRAALEYLLREGVGEGVVLAFWRGLKGDPEKSVLSVLRKVVRAVRFCKERWPQKFHALAGPSGVGKTSVLLRLALEYARVNPGAKICLADADNAQGRGRLFLKHYAGLSEMAYREISNQGDVSALAEQGHNFDKIFMDLPCMTGESSLEKYLDVLGLAGKSDLAVHMVLSPHFAPDALESFARRYKSSKTAGIIWTKLDEACNYGAVANVAYFTGLPVSALSFGPGLRGTLVPAQDIMLWKLLFKHQLPESVTGDTQGGGFAK
ncbi:MAG: flagellar biosynthesis protein FlhF [Thermodesulfobacteriota bacterium]|nr:flagellar biosynthesis protein FlhF [Thermodesulfobacteriota bacterium]